MWRHDSALRTNIFLLIALTFCCFCHFGASLGRPAVERNSPGKNPVSDSVQREDAEKENVADEGGFDGEKPYKDGEPYYVGPPRVVAKKEASFSDAMTNDIHDADQRPVDGPRLPSAGDVARPPADGTGKETAVNRATDGAAAKYMWELYERFSADKYSHPRGNTVRTFKSINTGR